MQFTIAETIEKHAGLKEIEKKAFPVSVSYAISLNLDRLKEVVEKFEQKRAEAAARCAEKDENGKPIVEENRYKISAENLALLNKEINDFLQEKTDVDVRKIRMESLDPCDRSEKYSSLTPAELKALDFMIDIPGDGEAN